MKQGNYVPSDSNESTSVASHSSASNNSIEQEEYDKAVCLDCNKPYGEFNMDMFLPHSQWVAIHPERDGLLCAQCIVNRASKLKGAVVIHAIIEVVA